MGWDGLAMLALSLAVTAATAGVSLLVCWAYVLRTAWSAGTLPQQADLLVVFGVRLDRSGAPGADFQARLGRVLALRSARPLLILGGRTDRNPVSESEAGQVWLEEQGWQGESLAVADQSRNTLENLHRVRDAMREHGYARPALVTNRYHLARSSVLAAGLGIAHELCAAEDQTRFTARMLAKSLLEAMLLNWYYVGRYWARTTRNPYMLKRIS